MTKAELLAAIAAAPDDALVYIDINDGILRSALQASVDVAPEAPAGHEIFITWEEV